MSDSSDDSSNIDEESIDTDSHEDDVNSEAPNWADSSSTGTEICTTPVEDWVENLTVGSNSFETTADVPLPKRLVDQVIGQDAASIVVRKAAEQRRHVILMGDPGTGKSMLARSMTEFLPKEQMEDILVYRNPEDENEPKVRTVPAGRGDRIIKERKAAIRQQRERTNKTLLFIAIFVGAALVFATISTGDILTLLFGGFILAFGYFFLRSRLTAADENNIPKLLVKHERGDDVPFVDATGALAGALLGDVRHDPFQSGADLATPAHERVPLQRIR